MQALTHGKAITTRAEMRYPLALTTAWSGDIEISLRQQDLATLLDPLTSRKVATGVPYRVYRDSLLVATGTCDVSFTHAQGIVRDLVATAKDVFSIQQREGDAGVVNDATPGYIGLLFDRGTVLV